MQRSIRPLPRRPSQQMTAPPPIACVVVPVYNGEAYLRESLDSIVSQTYPHLRILVMDDASTDSTPLIIASYGNRIASYRQPQNRGQFANVNDGISKAEGDYIAVFHADDVYLPTIVQKQVDFLQRYPEAGAVFALDTFIDAAGREYGRLEIPEAVRGGRPLGYPVVLNALLAFKNTFLVTPSAMVRASTYRELGEYRGQDYRIAADFEMWVRIAEKYPLGILEEHLVRYRHGHGNSSKAYYHLRDEPERYFRIMDLYLANGGRALATADALREYEAHRAEDRLMLAVNLYIRGELGRAREVLEPVQVRQLWGRRNVQYVRLAMLLFALRALMRLPRIALLADQFYQHWYTRKYAKLR